MCSEFQSPLDFKKIQESLDIGIDNSVKKFEWGSKVGLHQHAPVLEKTERGFNLTLKVFPSSPLPNARLSGIGSQTDGNDKNQNEAVQIRRIYEMPRWKEGFKSYPVLVPMRSFTEFAYWGDQIGTGQSFTVPNEKIVFTAGIEFKPFAPAGGKNSAFALLTHTATEQMLQYHQRLIVVLKAETALGYLDEMTNVERFNFLIENRYVGEFHVETLRKMSKGWEKKLDLQAGKLKRELEYRAILKKENVVG